MDLTRIPRRLYTAGPTPIERLDRLTRHLGGPDIYIKRDDLTGLAGGGNKTRKLEFLVADALAKGCDTLVTTGAMQSNHCRLTLAAAVQEGMSCRLVLRRATPEPYRASGNMLLYDLLGAERVELIDDGADCDAAMAAVAAELEAVGRRAHVIPLGGSDPLGALGYAVCAREIVEQSAEAGLDFDRIICVTGSGGTHAGLLAGLWALGAAVPVTGINVSRPAADRNLVVRDLAAGALDLIGASTPLPENWAVSRDEWLGPGYALPSEEMIEAVRLVARTEGVLLDPVYTGKAMAGLIGMIRAGELVRGQKVLFVHTGGAPALYAYRTLFEAG